MLLEVFFLAPLVTTQFFWISLKNSLVSYTKKILNTPCPSPATEVTSKMKTLQVSGSLGASLQDGRNSQSILRTHCCTPGFYC